MPRLQKGETASGVRAKQLRAQASVKAMIEILNEAVVSGAFLDGDVDVFRRVSTLASMDDEARGISPMSVRTLRDNIDAMYGGGMKAFRATVAEICGVPTAAAAKSVEEPWLEDAVLDMTARYSDLLQRFKRVALDSAVAEEEIKRHFSRYRGQSRLRVVK